MTVNNSITDNYANVWTFVNGVVYINGTLAGFSSGVTSLLLYPANGPNPVLYQNTTGNLWWGAFGVTAFLANGSSVAWTGPQADPRTLPLPTPPTPTPPTTSSMLFGVNISGMEVSPTAALEAGFGPATNSDYAYLASKGVKFVRLALAWENIQPELLQPLSTSYMPVVLNQLSLAAANGIKVLIDIHNTAHYVSQSLWSSAYYYAGNAGNAATGVYVMGDSNLTQAAFVDLWTRLATALVGNPGLGGYGLMNEPANLPNNDIVPPMYQAAINAIRAIDTKTPIYVMGPNGWGNYTTWTPGQNFPLIGSGIVYEAHFYWDGSGGVGPGTYTNTFTSYGIPTNIAVTNVEPFIAWLKQYGLQGFIGEFGVPNDTNDNDAQWLVLQQQFAEYLAQQTGVIVGATEWLYGCPGVPLHTSGTNPLNVTPVNGVDDARLLQLMAAQPT